MTQAEGYPPSTTFDNTPELCCGPLNFLARFSTIHCLGS
jgi:hypothetical protein